MGTLAGEKRTLSIRVKMTAEMKARAERAALSYGLPLATFAAVALGHYVRVSEGQANALDRIGETMGDKVASEIRDVLKAIGQANRVEAGELLEPAAVDLGEARK